jgi:two-component system LytT family response regulator
MTFSTLIIEDEFDAKELLTSIIVKHCPSLRIIGYAVSIKEAISMINEYHPDIIFADIQLKDGSVFDALDQVKNLGSKIIFTTADDKFALQSYDYATIHYILKPYYPQQIIEAVHRIKSVENHIVELGNIKYYIEQKMSMSERVMVVSTTDSIERVSIDDIVYIKADRAYCILHLKNGISEVISKPLNSFEAMVQSSDFIRTHLSYMVNVRFIKKYSKKDGGGIELNDGTIIPISRRKRKEIMRLFFS